MLFIHKVVRQDASRYLTSKIVFICDIQARSLENSGDVRLTTGLPKAITGESLVCKFQTLLKEQVISGRGNR